MAKKKRASKLYTTKLGGKRRLTACLDEEECRVILYDADVPADRENILVGECDAEVYVDGTFLLYEETMLCPFRVDQTVLREVLHKLGMRESDD